MHKTGSSSIQEALACLRSNEFIYCDLMHPNHSMAFYTLFSKNYLNYHEWQKQGLGVDEIIQRREEYLQIFNKHLDYSGNQKIIFSAESISLLKDDEKKDLITFFKDHGCEINIICYVRDPLSFAYSSFQQDIKSGSINIKEIYSPNYLLRIDEFKKNPLINKLIVRNFNQLKDNNIVSDFFNLLGIDDSHKKDFFSNKSLSISALKIIFLLNKHLKKYLNNLNSYESRLKFINLIEKTFQQDDRKYREYFCLNIDYGEVSYLRDQFSINYKINDKRKTDSVDNTLSRLEDLSDVDSAGLTNLAKDVGVECTGGNPESWIISIYEFFLRINESPPTDS